MKEQMAKMIIIELVKTAHNYATSIKQTGVYSDLVGEIASRLEALNLAYIGLTKKSNGMQSERDHLASQLADVVAENAALQFYLRNGPVIRKDGELAAAHQFAPAAPATDSFIAEQRAVGVEMAIKTAKSVVAQEFQYKDFDTAQRVCSRFPESDLVGKVEMVEWLSDFAAQLRNEVKV